MSAEGPSRPVEDPHAQLERALIEEYLQTHGHTLATVHALPDAAAKALLREASRYASGKLTEVESRAHYVDEIHDKSQPLPARGPRSG
jgi:aminoglycoside phosphotransferase (APT) family kinase protein